MPFQGKTIGAQCVIPRPKPAVWQKLPVCGTANRALNIVSPVDKAQDPGSNVTEPLQMSAGNKTDNPTNEFFHDALTYEMLFNDCFRFLRLILFVVSMDTIR